MKLVNLKGKSEYSLMDIKKLLRISNPKKLNKIKVELIRYLKRRKIEFNEGDLKVNSEIFECFFKTKPCKNILKTINTPMFSIKLESKDDILSRELISEKDIEILLDCSEEKAKEIANEIKKMMQERGVPLLLDHFLTSYFLEYIKYNLYM